MSSKPKLSKGVLDMKFMKRTKEKFEKEDADAEGRAMYSNEITDRMISGTSNFIIEPSFIYCEDLISGRYSCRGINPEIERILELEEAERQAKQTFKMESDITDKEMTDYYSNVTKTIQKKFNYKRKSEQISNGTKKKFLKPTEDDDK